MKNNHASSIAKITRDIKDYRDMKNKTKQKKKKYLKKKVNMYICCAALYTPEAGKRCGNAC
jgi:hypothetical protein